MRNLRILFLVLAIAGMFSTTTSAPIFGEIRRFRQPDGDSVPLRLFGDEFYIRAETEDEYTVVRDKQTGWICYATQSSDGMLVSTGVAVESDDHCGLAKKSVNTTLARGLKASVSSIRQSRQEARNALFGGVSVDYRSRFAKRLAQSDSLPSIRDTAYFSGTIIGLTLVWDFPDEPITDSYSSEQEALEHLERTFNSLDPADNSLRYYFRIYSGGKLDLIHIIKGVYRAPRDYAYYDQLEYGTGHSMLIDSALHQLAHDGFDFTQLSTTERGRIRSLCISNTGEAQTWAEGMWMHSGWLRSDFRSDDIRPGSYCTCSERGGALHHEMGHLIGEWPDLYSSSGEETGTWGIMGGGYTDLPNPYFLYQNGWLGAINLANEESGKQISADGVDPQTAHIYFKSARPDEFFFIKPYTRNLPFSSDLPDQGLTIWHIDLDGDNFNYPETPLLVELVHANNDITNKRRNVCFKETGMSAFSDETTPGALWRDGTMSGLHIYDISSPGSEMTFKLGADLQFINIIATGAGSVSPVGLHGVEHGSRFVLRAIPEQGYKLSDVLLDGQEIDFRDSLVISSVTGDHVVEITFAMESPFSESGQYFIRAFDGSYLMPRDGQDDNGAQMITQTTESPENSAIWNLTTDRDHLTTMTFARSQCADVMGGSHEEGAQLIIWGCHGGANQNFTLFESGNGWYKILSRESGLVIEAVNNGVSSVDSQLTMQQPNAREVGQLFRLLPIDRRYQLPARIEAEDFQDAEKIRTGIEENHIGYVTGLYDSSWTRYHLTIGSQDRFLVTARYKNAGEGRGSISIAVDQEHITTINSADDSKWRIDSTYVNLVSGEKTLTVTISNDSSEGLFILDWLEIRESPSVMVTNGIYEKALTATLSGNNISLGGVTDYHKAYLFIYSANGRCVKRVHIKSNQTRVSIKDLSAGFYKMSLVSGSRQIDRHFVKIEPF